MIDESIYTSLGKITEEMYLGLCKNQSIQMQEQLAKYHSSVENKITELLLKLSINKPGEVLINQQKNIQTGIDDFSNLKKEINSRYKIYLRGCGKAGKSTLLNALLSLDENIGSRMGKLPMTFTIDTYSDELDVNEAEIRMIDKNGKSKYLSVSRNKAIEISDKEEAAFKQSKEKCDEIIKENVRNVYLEQERKDIEKYVYKHHLMRTQIREIKWGIGANDFFRNCLLVDTPGLEQELRFANVIDDVKNYEIDGIIWVINSDTIMRKSNIDAYNDELKCLKEVYDGKKVIAVINMYGMAPDYIYGSNKWKKIESKARKIYCYKFGFNDLICVNAKMAYDGYILDNKDFIEQSNITELRKKINEMFVEKTTHEYHLAKLDKIDSFLNNLYRVIRKNHDQLEEYVFTYQEKNNKIKNLKNACEQMFATRKEQIISYHISNVKQRIQANITKVNNLDDEPDYYKCNFLENDIIKVHEIKSELNNCVEQYENIVFQRFKEQQIQSIISDYKTQKYAVQTFEKNKGTPLMINSNNIGSPISKGLGSSIYDFAYKTFGRDSIITGVVKLFRNMISSPEERTYKDCCKYIRELGNLASINVIIRQYEEECRKTLDESMEYTCGNYSEVCDVISYMKEFIATPPHMEWKSVGLTDIIGGKNYV